MQIEYFIVLAVSLAGPLYLSFSPKMDFWKYPLRLILSILLPFIIFVLWDMFVTSRGHWTFHPDYTVGIKIFNLPVEEVLFFIVIPFCGIFTWESVKYFMRDRQKEQK